MKHHRDMRGGFPVAALDTLPGPEQLLIGLLRLWSDGPGGTERLERMLHARLGPAAAETALCALTELFATIARHGRGELVRHRPHCSCVGTDEAVLAHFVMLAATGDREDALLVGALLVEGSHVLGFTEAARCAGLELCRADLSSRRAGPGRAAVTLH